MTMFITKDEKYTSLSCTVKGFVETLILRARNSSFCELETPLCELGMILRSVRLYSGRVGGWDG